MKKIFMLAIAAVAAMTSCSKEGETNGGNGGNPIDGKTYASFSFKFNTGASSRALADYNPDEAPASEVNDPKLAGGDMRLVIFNADNGTLEHNDVIGTGTATKTLMLTAGQKKIFVLANTSLLADHNGAAGDNHDARLAAFNGSLNDFYKLKFSAGTPQKVSSSLDRSTDARTFDLENLHKIVDPGTYGLPMSNTGAITYTLVADVTESQAQGGTAATSGSSATNTFKIELYYMTAKGRLVMGPAALKDGSDVSDPTIIENPFYAIKNLARYNSYVQKWDNGVAQSYYHNQFNASSTATQYAAEFDGAANVTVASSITPASCAYIYMPENTSTLLYRGQSTYFAIKLNYEPGAVVKTLGYDISNNLVMTTDKLSNVPALNGEGAKDYVYTLVAKGNIPAKTFFKTKQQFAQAVWMDQPVNKSTTFVPATHQAAADLLINATEYYSFVGATSWYRLDIGDGSYPGITLGVLRGHRYTATVDAITGPGVPNEEDLDKEPEKPVISSTHIHASIEAKNWVDVTSGGSLN